MKKFLQTLVLFSALFLVGTLSSNAEECLDFKAVGQFATESGGRAIRISEAALVSSYMTNLQKAGFNVPDTYLVATPASLAFLEGPEGTDIVILVVFNRDGCAETMARIPRTLHFSILREASN